MAQMDLKALRTRLGALAIFRALLSDPVIASLCEFLDRRWAEDVARTVSVYAEFVSLLYERGGGVLSSYIQRLVDEDENVYMHIVGRKETPSPAMQRCVDAELSVLQDVANLTPEILRNGVFWKGFLPEFETSTVNLADGYRHRVENIGQYGYGIYARNHMFYLNPENQIVPVLHPDEIRLENLVDYQREQRMILENTRALLAGKPAANILLTGDAGTGKSSTIKAVVNELYNEGLRILEIRKEQLRVIPAILDELTDNPLKFILFIDDLSFQKDDDHYNALKAVLEGSVSAKSQNVAIYATSNRRHLVKETFSSRDGDDIHRNDTMQEMLSLSDRFGLRITFQKPDKATYLDIVRHLAKHEGLPLEGEQLDALAERFALERGGRSPRAARQFIDSLVAARPVKRS